MSFLTMLMRFLGILCLLFAAQGAEKRDINSNALQQVMHSISEMKTEIATLKDRQKTVINQSVADQLIGEITSLHQELHHTRQELQKYQNQVETLKNASGPASHKHGTVAFSANIQPGTASNGYMMVPVHVISNIGGAYTNDGVFVCPQKGTYLFAVTLMAMSNSNGAWIFKNYERIAYAYISQHSNGWGSAATTAVLDLEVGDRVLLRPDSNNLSVAQKSIFTVIMTEWTVFMLPMKSDQKNTIITEIIATFINS